MTRFRLQRIWRAQSGLTLIELLAVVVILVILSLMAVPLIGEVTDRARTARSQEDLRLISDMLEAYKAERGHYPERLADLVDKGYLKPGKLESAWSSDDSVIHYDYFTDSRNDRYAIVDPGNGDSTCNSEPAQSACPLEDFHPSDKQIYRTSW
ncbi:MAG TPA: type II secretion system protein [Symbiobacteriaceae bacterium]|nr:type II secretion system protein [Symbiobacteriaceae bacterium]